MKKWQDTKRLTSRNLSKLTHTSDYSHTNMHALTHTQMLNDPHTFKRFLQKGVIIKNWQLCPNEHVSVYICQRNHNNNSFITFHGQQSCICDISHQLYLLWEESDTFIRQFSYSRGWSHCGAVCLKQMCPSVHVKSACKVTREQHWHPHKHL